MRLPSPGSIVRVRRGSTEYREIVGLLKGAKVAPYPTLAVLAGPSGTGKTLAATVLASELGGLLHRVDLDAVTGKYIGETEKNLAQLFAKASAIGATLFFDEADALFGKRSATADSHDRYANLEIGYLLARHRGVVMVSVRDATPPPSCRALRCVVIDC